MSKLGEMLYYLLYGKAYQKNAQTKMVFNIKKGQLDVIVSEMLDGKIKMDKLVSRLEESLNNTKLKKECAPSRY